MDNPLSSLQRLMVERLSLSEVETLCFDLRVNYEDLPGETLSDKTRELILTMGRRRELERLLWALAQNRPDLAGTPALRSDPGSLAAMYRVLPSPDSQPVVTARPSRRRRIALTIVVALGLIGAIFVMARWDEIVALTGPAQTLTPTTQTSTAQAPHAAPIDNTWGVPLYDEQTRLVTIASGEVSNLVVMDLWSAPVGAEPSCASAFLVFTWQVREPYPGGDEFRIGRAIPMGGGRSEVLGQGASGQLDVGWCDAITLENQSLQQMRVEIRYASGVF